MYTNARTHTRRALLGGIAGLGIVAAGTGIMRSVSAWDDAATASPGTAPDGAPKPAGAKDAHRSRFVSRPPTAVREPLLTVPGRGRSLFLTFDDGPHPQYTPAVLRILRRYDVRATFCVIGSNAAGNTDLLRAIAADGHTVANHSWSHPQLTKLSGDAIYDELERTTDVIGRVVGTEPRWCRAPYGSWDRLSLGICADLGMEPLGWSVDTNDWKRPGAHEIALEVVRGADPGAIVLTHDGGGDRSQSVEALRMYLPYLLDWDFAFGVP